MCLVRTISRRDSLALLASGYSDRRVSNLSAVVLFLKEFLLSVTEAEAVSSRVG